ncbi:MAG: VCBS repeat-containing protein [Mangrovibacterium sp.]|nr:VCBS repeat-containing protein [Mangrovibacterium sp.]
MKLTCRKKKIALSSRNLVRISLCITGVLYLGTGYSQKSVRPEWTHFYIDQILPGSSWGTGGPAPGDYDHDGDLDVVISRRNSRQAYWYERVNDSIWIPHVMGQSENLAQTLGTTALDIDHDGWLDAMFQGVWFRNPGTLDKHPDAPWKASHIKAGGHDAVATDPDGNGSEDLVIYDGRKLAWYNTSHYSIPEIIIDFGYDDHGGIAPHGFGDLDNDGDADVVIPQYWFENPGNGIGRWIRHEWPYGHVPDASYGRSIRSWIADINKDGKNDIVYSDCDTGGSHVYWVENKNNGANWEVRQLPDPPAKEGDVPGTGSFHSLGVADFDLDGNLDIFAGEQEDPDTYMESEGKVAMKPRGLKERGVIWYNKGGKNPEFEMFVICVDNPGWHDAQVVDIDGDGDTDIVSKIWNADRATYHADYWRNEVRNGFTQTE